MAELWPSRLWLFALCASLLVMNVIAVRHFNMSARKDTLASLESFKRQLVFLKKQRLKEEPSRTTAKLPVEEENDCENKMNKENCLKRRILEAHTDYIYTQNRANP